jgi:hypothetical protein
MIFGKDDTSSESEGEAGEEDVFGKKGASDMIVMPLSKYNFQRGANHLLCSCL